MFRIFIFSFFLLCVGCNPTLQENTPENTEVQKELNLQSMYYRSEGALGVSWLEIGERNTFSWKVYDDWQQDEQKILRLISGTYQRDSTQIILEPAGVTLYFYTSAMIIEYCDTALFTYGGSEVKILQDGHARAESNARSYVLDWDTFQKEWNQEPITIDTHFSIVTWAGRMVLISQKPKASMEHDLEYLAHSANFDNELSYYVFRHQDSKMEAGDIAEFKKDISPSWQYLFLDAPIIAKVTDVEVQKNDIKSKSICRYELDKGTADGMYVGLRFTQTDYACSYKVIKVYEHTSVIEGKLGADCEPYALGEVVSSRKKEPLEK